MPHNRIILQKINLQGASFQIPVADMSCGISGPTILITGGMDGDEYTGIRAAYELITYYSKRSFPGRIIILPIVNVMGFYEGKSLNPLDNKYPKYIFPGNKNGSSTEQLVNWLFANYVTDAAAWIDLHSGAITERLRPFIWGFETKNKKINLLTKSILGALNSSLVVYEKALFLSKASRLASRDCVYLVFERGEKGEQRQSEIEKMTQWVEKTIDVVNGANVKQRQILCFEKVRMYQAPFDGMWIPSVDIIGIEKGTIAGRLQTLDRKKEEIITIKESGEVLWMKVVPFAKKGDELIVIATSKRLV